MKKVNKLIQLIGFGLICASLIFVHSVVEWRVSEILEVFNQIF